MPEQMRNPQQKDCWEASGLLHLLRTLGLAVHPTKLVIALAAILLTVLLGWLLDAIWLAAGHGTALTSVAEYTEARDFARRYEYKTGEFGISHVWRNHERNAVLGLLGSSIPGRFVAAGTTVGAYVDSHSHRGTLHSLLAMGYGVRWLVRYHPFFSLLFGAGTLLIWAFAGGAICRCAAIQFARAEKLTVRQSLQYGIDKLFSGFFLAPCIPIGFMIIVGILLGLGGLLLRVPVVGDLLAGATFFLAIFGGFVMATLLVGFFVGGSLFWPSVAVEGSDAFDSFSRSLSYALSKPWKAVWYAAVMVVYAAVCWVVVHLFTYLSLSITRAFVGSGTAPFGWWKRDTGTGDLVSKLELLWPLSGPNELFIWPTWSQLTWYEYSSAFFIGVYVMLVIGLMWSFLASFYFCGSTVVYLLLRRDVDGADLEDVYVEEEEDDDEGGNLDRPAAPPKSSDVSLPVTISGEYNPPPP